MRYCLFVLLFSLLCTCQNYGPCTWDGVKGVCIDYNQCTGTSTTEDLCPGPDNIRCCVTDWGSCNFNGASGVCMDYHHCNGTSITANICPGPDQIQCCIRSGPTPKLIDVPIICQLPELLNGCEVTSMTMVLRWAGINADKMTLASQVAKDPTPYSKVNGVVHWGNPNVGFVGDITGHTLGYAVYHGPVLELAKRYHGAIDLTGQSFEQVLSHVAAGSPVWVITSFSFEPVPPSDWQTVISPEGSYRMSFNEHSVVITGFNNAFVWVNDPYANIKNRQLNRANFEIAWQQFGNQSIVLV
eukprot:TRINITY_DN14686_c0_g1_i1.p1 TRINITY_DN14686_c0_g1~~TRINITY_DN14686_c0_g1_i1.p1  ORF type:complete len:299 (-),score=28.71 TRINITY_DN14686_c0_g1_i1:31-927(-)